MTQSPGCAMGLCQKQQKSMEVTYTLWAQRVTRRPSFMHSNSPRPGLSVLHCM